MNANLRSAPIAMAVCLLSSLPRAAVSQPILHERLPDDPAEDLALGNETAIGGLPAALKTRSGVVSAPRVDQPLPSTTYAFVASGKIDEERFDPDLDTRRPDVTLSRDVFTPSLSPYERFRVFDSVAEDFSLRVKDRSVSAIPLRRDVLSTEDRFYEDVTVAIERRKPVRIPSPGASAALVKLVVQPPSVSVEVVRDGADNWFVRGAHDARVRVMMVLSVPRGSFGGDFRRISRSRSVSQGVPKVVRDTVGRVVREVGFRTRGGALPLLGQMVSYFRSFQPTEEPLQPSGNRYEQLVSNKKGVCRHRAYAFTVTALALGFETRMVANEAHAWVEVRGADGWKRIDLGGASRIIERQDALGRQSVSSSYQPLKDPFPWDEPQQAASNALQATNTSRTPRAGSLGRNEVLGSSDHSAVTISWLSKRRARRGDTLQVRGWVSSGGKACGHGVVTIMLRQEHTDQPIVVGIVDSGVSGSFEGDLAVPPSLRLGSYEVIGRVTGCGHAAGEEK